MTATIAPPERLDVELQRNADFVRELEITDSDGVPLDLTGATFAWKFKRRAGDPNPPVASATVTVTGAAAGLVRVEFSGSAFSDIEGQFEPVRIAYDFIGTQDGKTTLLARGYLTLLPGVS